eukprot:CAMPEP_0115118246 /NCGR_PEP_ID=MMETSP0227-20121206/44380_1 /TAXON_ID=89957 /ORGANISM="Polarella glacialis, Strain CCMP 1383" /LENGTH=127 /DNA_ID=CAMNT_0002519485 /DNA_START=816 /DNA_END=1199 /DNA_ORIENTATION=+
MSVPLDPTQDTSVALQSTEHAVAEHQLVPRQLSQDGGEWHGCSSLAQLTGHPDDLGAQNVLPSFFRHETSSVALHAVVHGLAEHQLLPWPPSTFSWHLCCPSGQVIGQPSFLGAHIMPPSSFSHCNS